MSGYPVQYGQSAYPYEGIASQLPPGGTAGPRLPGLRLTSSSLEGGVGNSYSNEGHGEGGDEQERWGHGQARHVNYSSRAPYWSPAQMDEAPATSPYQRLPVPTSLGLSLAPVSNQPNHAYSPYPRGGPYGYFPPSSTSSGPAPPMRLKSDFAETASFTSRAPYSPDLLSPIQALAALSNEYSPRAHHDHAPAPPKYPLPPSSSHLQQPSLHYSISLRAEHWNTMATSSTASYADMSASAAWGGYSDRMHYSDSGPSDSGSGAASYGTAQDRRTSASAAEQPAPAKKSRSREGKPPIVKKWACDLCVGPEKRSFARPSALKIHQLTHTKEKPHVCHICSRAFAISSNLKRHYKLHQVQ